MSSGEYIDLHELPLPLICSGVQNESITSVAAREGISIVHFVHRALHTYADNYLGSVAPKGWTQEAVRSYPEGEEVLESLKTFTEHNIVAYNIPSFEGALRLLAYSPRQNGVMYSLGPSSYDRYITQFCRSNSLWTALFYAAYKEDDAIGSTLDKAVDSALSAAERNELFPKPDFAEEGKRLRALYGIS